MQKSLRKISAFLFAAFLGGVLFYGLNHNHQNKNKQEIQEEGGKFSKKDMVEQAIMHEFEITKDLALNIVPRDRLIQAYKYAEELRTTNRAAIPNFNWVERGPNNFGGRTRSILVDPNDGTKKKVFAASPGGGLWKCADITLSTPGWVPINDFFANLSVTTITYNPLNTMEMYFGTGEGWQNADAIRGNGIWKSNDGGVTWTQLSSTTGSSYYYVQKILVHPVTGDVYAATRSGLFRSQNGGTTWTKVLGAGTGGVSDRIADLEIASDNTLYAAAGIFQTDGIY
ncbi:MAG TPA: hypothetical protein VI757_13320, partial [Bacteroidia bacterium]|nr:hypothetical protein [Bacteroidia bacterium]